MAEDTRGKLGHSHEGIEIWNRSWETYKARFFPDDAAALPMFAFGRRLNHARFWSNLEYWFTPANTKYSIDHQIPVVIKAKKPIIGIRTIFAPGRTVLDVGCGGGDAAIGMARENRQNKIIAADYELGKEVPFPVHDEPNLTFQQEDWRAFTLADNSVDSLISDMGIGKYGNTDVAVKEMTRVAKIGSVFRGTQVRGVYGIPNFNERLAEAGWNVWHLRNPVGKPTHIIIAELINK